MSCRFLGAAAIVFIAGCSGSREPTRDTPVVALNAPTQASSAPVVAISSASQTSAAPPPAEPIASAVAIAPSPSASTQAGPSSAYPQKWIEHARGENSALSCLELVYKDGCKVTRTGTVTFQVTIDDNGSVVQFSEVDNQIHHDKAVVSRCLKKNMPRWKFRPPEGHEKTFQVTVALSDMC